MKYKDIALRVTGTIFGIVSILHLLRLITGVLIEIADLSMPIWFNILGFIASAILCAVLCWLSESKIISRLNCFSYIK